jgi:hypothetical protein
MKSEMERWALKGIQAELDKLEAQQNRLELDRARDRLVPHIRERIADPKRAKEAFEAFLACDEYGAVKPTDADEKRVHVWLSLADSSKPFRKPPEGGPAPAAAEPAPVVEPEKPTPVMSDTQGFLKAIGWL